MLGLGRLGTTNHLPALHYHGLHMAKKRQQQMHVDGHWVGDLCREFIAEDHRYYLNVIK